MDESNKSEGQTPLPAQQAQQPQPTTALNDHQIQTPQMHSVSDVSRRNSKGGPTSSGKGSGGEPKSDGGDSKAMARTVARRWTKLASRPESSNFMRHF